ncbi:excinuclease ABC subunit C [Phormidesmis priestleyi ULC007]|uniref:Excinuclease ABC subunit C n=1 Tax=Phormidesmis priestleyi ULC007 TaxID=1920490 RepID=A0A2T1DFM6_9CYAN|nr:GIY-YIG nuclease family protein [Phormidesmis priestleyi]PSB19251.1 excinuclease ABC subunit C [Phormidesmis priestleyi ULC007]PZO48206.1 MAG: excinuclease ABC subunit C [Phormidesmis priestleyi]
MPSKKTQQQLIAEFHQAHGDYYDYSSVEYVNSPLKIRVICPIHGEFEISPGHHKNGVGCRKCYFESQKILKEELVHRSQKHFGNRYDYSLFIELPKSGEQVSILCREHNIIFLQEPRNHIGGHTGCPECLSITLAGSQQERGEVKSKEDLNNLFVERARNVHGNKYDYSQFKYLTVDKKGRIFCPKHGEFWQTPSNHLRGTNCPSCSRDSQRETTFKNKCKELGVNYWRSLKRREAGLSEEKIFDKEYVRGSRKVGEIIVFGVKYPNLKEAIRCLNPLASRRTIARWIRAGIPPEEAFDRIPNPGYAEGIIYLVTHKKSGKQYVGLTIQTLERRWKYHVEQAFAGYIKGNESLHYALRENGSDAFEIRQIDRGTSKKDLEKKEREWIKKLGTLIPNGYNISTGGVSGGSNKKVTCIDDIRFESVEKAAIYLSETRNISLSAAKKRISQCRVNVKTIAKPGESLTKTKAYKAWSRIIHGALNPKSKEYIPRLEIYDSWRDFKQFLRDVGNPPEESMAFSRIDKDEGFFPDNCAWLTKSESSIINAEYMKKKGKLGRKNALRV